jgi:hypothetical protein
MDRIRDSIVKIRKKSLHGANDVCTCPAKSIFLDIIELVNKQIKV